MLPGSETFVRNHGAALPSWEAAYLGATKVGSPLALPSDVITFPPTPEGRRAFLRLRLTGESPRLRSVLSRLRPDLVHAHYLIEFGWHAWIAGFHPYAITVWGSDVSASIPRSLRTRLFGRMSLRRADLVTGVSMALVRDAINAGARPETARHIHFGVDTDRFAPGPDPLALRERLGLQGRRIVFSPRALTT